MRAIGPAQSGSGVITRSYEVTGYKPAGALSAYSELLRNGNSWADSVEPHAVGSSYRAAWTSTGKGPIATGYTLAATAIDAPTLSGNGNSSAIQMTLQLYAPHATPSTETPST